MIRLVTWSLLTFLLTLGLLPTAFADSEAEPLTLLEQQVLGREYGPDPLEERISRLESILYGKAGTGDLTQRQTKLISAFATLAPQSQKASSQQTPPSTAKVPQAESGFKRAQDGTDYPTVSQMEKNLFERTFSQEDIASRLNRLEQRVFQQTFNELPMVDRVDQLTLKVLPENPLIQEEKSTGGLPSQGTEFASSNLGIYSKLTALEEYLFGKSFGGELIVNRLTRLEKKVFGGPRQGAIDDRLERLLSHYMERPSAQSDISQSPYSSPPARRYPTGPQVHLGSMYGSNYQFSSEMLNMLPAHVRHRLETQGQGQAQTQENSLQGPAMVGGGMSSSTQTHVYSGPSSWTTRQQTQVMTPFQGNSLAMPNTPSIQPYYGHPIQYPFQSPQHPWHAQSYPNPTPSNSLIPPLIQTPPLGTPYTINPGMNSAVTAMANQYGPSLSMLEQQFFGQTYHGMALTFRLNQLEQQVFGITYPQYPIAQRMQRLMQQAGYRQGQIPSASQQALQQMAGQALNMMMFPQAGITPMPVVPVMPGAY